MYGPNEDTLNALIVFSMLEEQNKPSNLFNLRDEIALLKKSLHGYHPRVTNDPLGWGLESLFNQFVEGHPRTEQLVALAPEALHSSHLSLPFRMYGALIGALVAPSSVGSGSFDTHQYPPQLLQDLLDSCVNHQFQAMKNESKGRYAEEHSSINRTMLAVALLIPGELRRRDADPMVQF